MEYAISIKLTEKQYHLIKEMAKGEYRTMGNTLAMLAASGFHWYIQDHEVCVKRVEQDRDSEQGEYQWYRDPEMIEIMETMPLNQ